MKENYVAGKASERQKQALKPSDDLLKLSPELRALVEPDRCHQGAGKAPTVEDGKVKIRIVLSDQSDGVIRSLEALGIKVLHKATAGKVVAALAPVEKLRELVKLKQVLYVQSLA